MNLKGGILNMNSNKGKILSSIVEAFNFTTKLPIICIDRNGDIVEHFGYTNEMLIKISKINIYDEILSDEDLVKSKRIKFLSFNNNCEIAIKFISINGVAINHFFLLGPYRSKINLIDNTLNTIDYQFRPRFCVDYLVQILISIINDITNDNIDDNQYYISLNVRKAIQYIHKEYDSELTIDLMSKKLKLNKCYFCNIFKKETGLTFSNFINKFRVEKSKHLLINSSLSILDVAIAVGFNNQNYFSMAFKKETGVTPLQYKKELSKI